MTGIHDSCAASSLCKTHMLCTLSNFILVLLMIHIYTMGGELEEIVQKLYVKFSESIPFNFLDTTFPWAMILKSVILSNSS